MTRAMDRPLRGFGAFDDFLCGPGSTPSRRCGASPSCVAGVKEAGLPRLLGASMAIGSAVIVWSSFHAGSWHAKAVAGRTWKPTSGVPSSTIIEGSPRRVSLDIGDGAQLVERQDPTEAASIVVDYLRLEELIRGSRVN
jgi:hypothetical protein